VINVTTLNEKGIKQMDKRVKDLMGNMMYGIFDSINNADIITKDGGFIVKLPDGSEYQIDIQKSK
jgi:hypothetical protein